VSVDVDPISFEVLRHRLWQINDEQGVAIRTVSASPIVVEGNDFNVGLFDRRGRLATSGSGSLIHVNTLGFTIRNFIESGLDFDPGDVLMTNDPYLGAVHQNDVIMASPLFVDGEIVLWIGNVLHHADVGGIDEGSFCINARSLFQEPARYFLKIARGGRIDPAVERTFVTNSRLPDAASLDLRAQLGGIHVARERLEGLMAERGVEVVSAVVDGLIDDSREQLSRMLGEIPDGTWHGEAHMDGDRVGSDRVVTVTLEMTKRGDRLHFDYAGSSPQVDSAVNCTWHSTYAGSTVPVYAFLCGGEIDWNAGLEELVTIDAPSGTVVNAEFPAPVSICTIGFRWLVTVAANQAVARMLSASPAHRDRVCPSWGVSCNANNLFHHSPSGKTQGALLSDHRCGGAAARSFADGFSHSGQITAYSSNAGNVETTESKLPVLYLMRRQLTDSGGPGRFRGGVTAMSALTPYGVDQLTFKSTNTAGTEASNAAGIEGGFPGGGSQAFVCRDADPLGALAGDGAAFDPETLVTAADWLPSKADGIVRQGDVFGFYPPGGGGFSDPLLREPWRVRDDVAVGLVSDEDANGVYGVVLTGAGVDEDATRVRREELRTARLEGASTVEYRLGFDVGNGGSPSDTLEVAGGDGDPEIRCTWCGHTYEHTDDGDAVRARGRRGPVGGAGRWVGRRVGGDSSRFELQQVLCPGCGTLVSTDERRVDEG
jgi:N-methylhydantoinase B